MHYQRWVTTGDPGEAGLRRRPSSPHDTEKPCSRCKVVKPVDEFYGERRNRDGKQSTCKVCFDARQTTSTMRRKYGLQEGDYERLLTTQQGLCKVCAGPPDRARLVVDHCHRTGQVRGLLCDRCNRLLGVADDDQDLLRAAVAYLKQSVR